jgi:hypothetical protein
VQKNLESQENQKALAQRAVYLGWSPGKVRVIDADLAYGRDTGSPGLLVQQISIKRPSRPADVITRSSPARTSNA